MKASKNLIEISRYPLPRNVNTEGGSVGDNDDGGLVNSALCAVVDDESEEKEEEDETVSFDRDRDDMLACLAHFTAAGDRFDGRERLRDCGGPWWNHALLDDEPSDTGFDPPSWTSADARPLPPWPWPRPRDDTQARGGWGFLAFPTGAVAPAVGGRVAPGSRNVGRWGGEGCGARRYYNAPPQRRRRSNSGSSRKAALKSKTQLPKTGSPGEEKSTWAPRWGEW
jgi:hypothetical protein